MTICCNNSEFFLVKHLFSCSLPKQDNLLYKDKRPVDIRLSKNLYNEKGRPPYPYKSAKSRDLCVAFCTSQGRGAPLANILCPGVYNLPEPRKTGSGGSPPAPCKNSKKWPKPLFRHARYVGHLVVLCVASKKGLCPLLQPPQIALLKISGAPQGVLFSYSVFSRSPASRKILRRPVYKSQAGI